MTQRSASDDNRPPRAHARRRRLPVAAMAVLVLALIVSSTLVLARSGPNEVIGMLTLPLKTTLNSKGLSSSSTGRTPCQGKPSCPPQQHQARRTMSTITVSDSTALMKALASAQKGDVIKLAAGTYQNVSLQNVNVAGVTITSADPGNKAVINNLLVKNSSGLTFSNLALTAQADAKANNFQVLNSSNITMDKLTVTGAGFDHEMFMIRNSQSVTLTNSEFTNAYNALAIMANTGLTITDNLFHDIRCDGIRGSLVSDLVIARNMFTDFHPRGEIGGAGDHADAIQLWTDNTTWIPKNITIDSNVFVRGEGEKVQGIWMRDNSEKQPFTNVSITNNVVSGGMYNGIAVWSGHDVNIANNTVAGFKDQLSWIRLHKVDGATLTSNKAAQFVFEQATNVVDKGSVKIPLGTSVDDFATRLKLLPALQGKLGALLGIPLTELLPLIPDHAAIAPAVQDVAGTDGVDNLKDSATVAMRLAGGLGNDSYTVSHAGTQIIEKAGEGQDRVFATISYVLPDAVEELWLQTPGTTGTGNALDNKIVGSTGDETLYGMDGNDTIFGGDGNDVLWGGNGNDDLRGENGNDQLHGGDGDDILKGGAGQDMLWGDAGNDTLDGGTGADTMIGGTGNDTYFVDDAGDTVVEQAGEGSDRVYSTVSYTLSANVEELWLQTAGTTGIGNALDNKLVGTSGDETLYGLDGNDSMFGGAGHDTLYGGNGNDDLRGEDGDDWLYGEAGNDTLRGGAGNDHLFGGDGNDVLEGGSGVDVCTGGAGADIFQFRQGDLCATDLKTITDFSRSQGDRINLTMVDANIGSAAIDKFKFIGDGAFTHHAGELNYEVVGSNTYLHGDVDGDGVADFTIMLMNVSGVSAQDLWI